MKKQLILIVIATFLSNCVKAQIQEGQICHADPELSAYNYAGLWEKFEDGWICNYWQFLSRDENIEIVPDSENELELDDGEIDKLMNEDGTLTISN